MATCSLLATKAQRCLHAPLLFIFFLTVCAQADSPRASTTKSFPRGRSVDAQDAPYALRSAHLYLSKLVRQRYVRGINGQLGVWDMVQLIALCGLIGAIGFWKKRRVTQHEGSVEGEHGGIKKVDRSNRNEHRDVDLDAESTDPGLLKKHSTYKSYTTSHGTYPRIRTFYRPHPQAEKLPSIPTPLPLLVIVHGLGGSLAQFNPLLTSLVNVAPCLGIDLPGCGLSEFSPTSWNHYSLSALVELLWVVIKEHCPRSGSQGVVLIGHSMGCSLSALLASPVMPLSVKGSIEVLGLVAICPRVSAPSPDQITTFRRILSVPTPIFDIWRKWDQRGGSNSRSVARFVGRGADLEVRRLQERYNAQSRTAVWRRMAWGTLPSFGNGADRFKTFGGLPGLEIWSSLEIPILLIAGEADSITNPEELTKISQAIRLGATAQDFNTTDRGGKEMRRRASDSTQPAVQRMQIPNMASTETTIIKDDEKDILESNDVAPTFTKRARVLKTSILPAPASHALLYDPTTYRTVAGLIQTFLQNHIDSRLSLGWQLQHLTTGGKWDVKNLAKWQAVRPVSEPIAGIFRAMKTLRQIDQIHCPEHFVKQWKGKIRAVIDISHESPVYDPRNLDEGGIQYHKFPTVSKIPPTPEETRDFIILVNRLRSTPPEAGWGNALIGVHCHYGFNRTGFFICSYLIEKEEYGVQQAIDEFGARRPPGIRHEHFLDTLFVRYCVGLKRAPTL